MTAPGSGQPEEEGSSLPALLAGIAIVGVAAYLIFGPDGSPPGADGGKQAAADHAGKNGKSGTPGRKVGVEDREIDSPDGPAKKYRRNPAIGMPVNDVAPPPPPKPIPDFKTPEEEIAFWEGRLKGLKAQLHSRETFVSRSQRRIDQAESADKRAQAEATHKTVTANRDELKSKVDELEQKLTDLRGG